MRKKMIAAVMCVLMLLTLGACAKKLENDGPVETYRNCKEIKAAVPGVVMSDAPSWSENILYNVTKDDPEHPVAQIMFQVEGEYYYYCAAPCASEAEQRDLFSTSRRFTESEKVTIGSAECTLKYSKNGTAGMLTWFDPGCNCQYCLYTDTGCGEDQVILEIAYGLLGDV